MPSFNARSLSRLQTCHPELQRLFLSVVQGFDCTVLCGFRGRGDQEEAFRLGNTTKHWPDSLHNRVPAMAVDVAPWPLDWGDRARFHVFGGYVLGTAASLGISVRWGGDWDRDTQTKDNRFDDLPHFELIKP